jgi:hypothetical protein
VRGTASRPIGSDVDELELRTYGIGLGRGKAEYPSCGVLCAAVGRSRLASLYRRISGASPNITPELVLGADLVLSRPVMGTALSLVGLGGRLLRTCRSRRLLDFRGTSGADAPEAAIIVSSLFG